MIKFVCISILIIIVNVSKNICKKKCHTYQMTATIFLPTDLVKSACTNTPRPERFIKNHSRMFCPGRI